MKHHFLVLGLHISSVDNAIGVNTGDLDQPRGQRTDFVSFSNDPDHCLNHNCVFELRKTWSLIIIKLYNLFLFEGINFEYKKQVFFI